MQVFHGKSEVNYDTCTLVFLILFVFVSSVVGSSVRVCCMSSNVTVTVNET